MRYMFWDFRHGLLAVLLVLYTISFFSDLGRERGRERPDAPGTLTKKI